MHFAYIIYFPDFFSSLLLKVLIFPSGVVKYMTPAIQQYRTQAVAPLIWQFMLFLTVERTVMDAVRR